MASIVDILLQVNDQATDQINSFTDSLEQSGAAGSFLANNLGKLSFAAAGAAVMQYSQALIENTKVLAEEARLISALSNEAGFSAKTIQTMTFAAEKLGVDTGDATDFLRDFNFEVGEAALKGSEGEAKFLNLGVSIKKSSGALKDNDTILREVSTALGNIQDTTQRAALAAQLFGEDNQKLLPILSQGADGLAQYTRELESMGAVIDEVAIARLREFDDTMKSISDSQKRLQIESIANAQAAAKASEIWTLGLNNLSSAFVSLINVEDENLQRMNEFANRHKQEVQPAIIRTIEFIEKEKKELEKLIQTQLKESAALEKQSRARKKLNDDIQNQIDLLKAESRFTGPTEARGLKEGIGKRQLDTELEKLREKGAESSQLEELRRLRTDALNEEFRNMGKEVKKAANSMEQVSESTSKASNAMEAAAESSTKRIGGLAGAFAGGDRATGLTNERLLFRPSFKGLANDPESLNRQFDRARAASVADILRLQKSGQLDLGQVELAKFIKEFSTLTEKTGFEFGQMREFAELGQERNVNIQFNPNQDFDNLSITSQRQLAEQIVQAGGIRQ